MNVVMNLLGKTFDFVTCKYNFNISSGNNRIDSLQPGWSTRICTFIKYDILFTQDIKKNISSYSQINLISCVTYQII